MGASCAAAVAPAGAAARKRQARMPPRATKPAQATKPGRRIAHPPKTGPEPAFRRALAHRQAMGGGGVPDAPKQGPQKPFLALHRPSYGPACPALPPAAYRPPAGAETWPARTRCHAARWPAPPVMAAPPEACTRKFAPRTPRQNVSIPECFGQNLVEGEQ